ncbi:hypothetical protein [Gloeocapsa sp. PCC 73106]|uniref:hypothetical protein n=1 Tax=Gloeocapsa sp. PCC 73106 TaxID=102232 RepID=UPI0002FF244F|nr:hypothetical protein [Gloeocapsa sp. PCC 73106]
MTEIDNFPVQQLTSRYNIGRSQVYTRLNQLQIQPHSLNRKSYITREELDTLDTLDDTLKQGVTIQQFINNNPQTLLKISVDDRPDDTFKRVTPEQLSLPLEGIAILIRETVKSLIPLHKANLDDLRMLQELVDNNWVIPTRRLAAIVNLSYRSLQGKKEYLYCGFRFSKSGKQGNSSLWKVERVVLF